MRKEHWAILSVFFVMLLSCGSNTSNSKDILVENQAQLRSMPVTQQQAYDVLGEWEQTYTVFDKNADDHLNVEERNNPSPTKIGDEYFHFHNDGNCTYSDMEFEGTYEIKMDKGKRILFVYGADPRRLRIVSLSKAEMVLMPSGAPGTFLVYRKYTNP